MKIYRAILFIALLIVLSISCIAATTNEFYFEDMNISVTFEDNGAITYEKQYEIAKELVYGINEEKVNNTATPNGLTCNIFGHKINSTLMYTVEHKVKQNQPRCLQTTYEVETCERCDYQNVKYVTDIHIICCPND